MNYHKNHTHGAGGRKKKKFFKSVGQIQLRSGMNSCRRTTTNMKSGGRFAQSFALGCMEVAGKLGRLIEM